MASLELRLPSELIGYAYINLTIPVPDDITPEQAARLHWEYNLRFLLEQNKISQEPMPEPVEAAVTKAATEVLTPKLPATKVAEEKVGAAEVLTAALGEMVEKGRASEVALDEMLSNPPEAQAKPWENKPKFKNLF